MAEDWLNKIRESQADFTEPEPEGLWEGIAAGLDGGVPAPVGAGKTRRRELNWLWAALPAAAVAALVLFLSVPGQKAASDIPSREIASASSGHFETEAPVETFDVVRHSSSSAPVSDNLLAYSSTPGNLGADVKKVSAENQVMTVISQDDIRKPSAVADDLSEKSAEPESFEVAADDAPVAAQDEAPATSPDETTAAQAGDEPRKQSEASMRNVQDTWPSENEKASGRGRRKGGFSFGLLASNVAGSRSSASEYAALYGSTVTRQIHGFSETEAKFPDSQGYADVMKANADNEISSNIRNFQPIQVGVNVAYSFTDKLSVESGLTYSCLISDISSGTTSGSYDIRQTLHYVGIPLNMRFDFLKFRRFSLYASAGGQMEKCVAGKTRTDYFIDGKKISSENGNIRVEPLQWSVNAYVGAQYSFSRLVGLYIEPGAAYYFGNGSPVNCIYNERPFNFSFRAGLRFSL